MLLLIQEGCSPHTHCLTDFLEGLYSETSSRSRTKDRKNAQRSAAKSSIMICSLLDRQVKIIKLTAQEAAYFHSKTRRNCPPDKNFVLFVNTWPDKEVLIP